MHRGVWLLGIVLIAWYILYYYRPPQDVAILQTTLADFSFDILLQRQPIVLYDRIAKMDELKALWFPRNKTVVYSHVNTEDVWDRNVYKHFILQPEQDTEVFLYPANKKLVQGRPSVEDVLLTVKLKAGQGVILPYRWYYCVPSGVRYHAMGIHDLLTPWLPRI
jgi:hypothetical protein